MAAPFNWQIAIILRARAIELRQSGASFGQIAHRLKISKSTAYAMAKQARIEGRKIAQRSRTHNTKKPMVSPSPEEISQTDPEHHAEIMAEIRHACPECYQDGGARLCG